MKSNFYKMPTTSLRLFALTITLAVSAFFSSVNAQTTLISPTGDGGFETGTTLALNNWIGVNAATNTWQVGAAATAFAGSRSAFVSNNGGTTWAYALTPSQTSHFYRDITVTAGQSAISLTFQWKGSGESGFDRLLVYTAPTSVTPVAGAPISPATAITNATLVLTQPSFAQATYTTATVTLPAALAGTTFRLIFTWQNDGSLGTTPGASVDNIGLTSLTPVPLTGTKTIKASGGDYSTFTAAVNDLNLNGVGTGGVTFNADAAFVSTEDVPAITATGTSANPIIFQRSGTGANPVIKPTGGTGSSDAGITIAGGDYITFDGIDITEATGSAVEYGYLIRNASVSDGAQNNTIKNVSIILNRANTSSVGILQSATTTGGGFTPTSAGGANSTNKYYNLIIKNAYAGIYLLGNATYPDLNCEVGTTLCTNFNTIGDASTSSDIGNGSSQTWGIRASQQNGAKIFNNTITNVTASAAIVDGILIELFQGTTNEVYNNKVSAIRNSGTSSTSSASGIRLSHATTLSHTIKVYNNLISAITHGFTGAATVSRYIKGINVSGTGGLATTVYNIDFNSVKIDGSASPNTSSTCYEIATGNPQYNVRNNIFSNVTAAQGAIAKHFTVVSTSNTSLGATGSVASFNDLYIANDVGTSGHVAKGSSLNYNTVSDFQTAYTTATNNLSTDPLFSADLHTNASALNGAADPAYATNSSWVTKDVDCETRPTTTDIGADEYLVNSDDAGVTAIILPSPLCAGSQSVQATVRNYGVSTITGVLIDWTVTPPGGSPTTYNPGAISIASGASQTFTLGSFTFAAGTTYSITATSRLPNGNTDGNTSNDAFTLGSIVTGLTGTYTIGTGGDFTTLTAAAAAFNTRTLCGPVIFSLTDATYSGSETFPITFNGNANSSSTNTLTIKPASGVTATISGSSASSIIKLNGADFIIIDGSNTSGGTDRSLTIENTGSTFASTAISIISLGAGAGATDNTIKNCIIKTGTIASTTYGISVSGATPTTAGHDNNNITIRNNAISKATFGINVRGTAGNEFTGLLITQNMIGSNTATDYITDYGMYFAACSAPVISQNEVFNLIASNSRYGIYFSSNINNAQVRKNKIYGFNTVSTSSFLFCLGIYFASSASCAGNEISNNVIYNMYGYGSTSTSLYGPIGIRITGGDTYKIYHKHPNIIR